ncbi:MAG TPA: PspC domain-containing protein [Candidatus Binatia bacterium]|jgi:phage shock protein PspC (stress-responsive transcriptional regulator)|nr:PspC domain-containing protein [Candidatus Binatia bacterium]
MEEHPGRRCPYCAEDVAPDALRCPHCRSDLAARGLWYRDQPDRRVAGVAAAVARGLGLPVTAVRLAFIVLAFVHFLGVVAYVALWLLLPFRAGEESPLERGLGRAKDAVRGLREGANRIVPGDPRP